MNAILIAYLLTASPAVDIDDPNLAERLHLAVVHHVTEVDALTHDELIELRAIAFKAVKSKRPDNRWAACLYLKHFGTFKAIPALEKMLADPVDRVAAEAANGLAFPGNERSLPALLDAFGRDAAATKANCIQAAGIIGGAKGEQALDRMQAHAKKAGHVNDLAAIREARGD